MQPEKIGRYEIKSELGRGGMATVYRGYDPRFDRDIAIKVLPQELLHSDPQFRLRFEREAKIIAQLEHPSIVPVYDVGEENDQLYFVMRYMGGGSLSERIKKGVFSVEEATQILEQIAPGMDEAHAKGFIHRDLKPGNILFDNKGTPHIADFGIAKITQSESGNVTGSGIIGTPAYMAPEQASGESIDNRTDIYALGVLYFEMLTGRQPYQADTPMGIAIKHVTDPVPRILEANSTLPTWVEMIISTAMAKNKNDRFSSAVEMTETIKAFMRGEAPDIQKNKTTIRGTPFNKTVTPAKKKGFNPLFAIVPLLLIGALVAGGFFLFNLFGKNSPSLTPTSIPVASPVEATSAPVVVESTATTAPSNPTETVTTVATVAVTDTPSVSALPIIGGADKIAFLHNNDIWLMNVDGSDLHTITSDGAKKFNLEWLPDGNTLLYITGKTVKTVNIETMVEENITSFTSSEYFESFHVSPDGQQAAISLSRELHVVPFDIEKLKNVTKKSALLEMKGCLFFNDLGVLDARWSNDGQNLSIKYLAPDGNNIAETIRILDIHRCSDAAPVRLDEFPLGRFQFASPLVSYDWDGDLLFFMNSNKRNGGFGEIGFYNTFTHKGQTKLAPINGTDCCYRDLIFSPDGTYVLFAFQDIRDTTNAVFLYYIPVDSLTTGGTLKPIPLPDGFFTQRDEAPMPAIRPAQK